MKFPFLFCLNSVLRELFPGKSLKYDSAEKTKFSLKHLLKKWLMENFIFRAVRRNEKNLLLDVCMNICNIALWH